MVSDRVASEAEYAKSQTAIVAGGDAKLRAVAGRRMKRCSPARRYVEMREKTKVIHVCLICWPASKGSAENTQDT